MGRAGFHHAAIQQNIERKRVAKAKSEHFNDHQGHRQALSDMMRTGMKPDLCSKSLTFSGYLTGDTDFSAGRLASWDLKLMCSLKAPLSMPESGVP